MNTRTLTMTAAALGLATLTNAATWTVGPGTSYDFPLIQQAINASASGDTIEVYPSTYMENLDLLGKDVHVRANAGLGSVIVDGGGLGPVITCVSGESNAAMLEGLTITNGASTDGGGLLIASSHPTVIGCHIVGNQATNGGGVAAFKSKTVFQYCIFEANFARAHGGHLDLRGGTPQLLDSQLTHGQVGTTPLVGFGGGLHACKTHLLVARCSIFDNTATRSGGGVYFRSANVVMEQCNIDNNNANDGGALFNQSSDLELRGVTSAANRATNNGGSMYFTGSRNVLLDGCHIEHNDAVRNGGAMFVRKRMGQHEIFNSTILRNLAGDRGAGICYHRTNGALVADSVFIENIAMNGGGIFSKSPAAIAVERTLFEANEAQQDGGGMYIEKSAVDLIECTLHANAAGNNGGGIKLEQSTGGGERLTFTDNTAIDRGGAIYLTDNSVMKVLLSNFDGNAANEGGGMLNEMNSSLSIGDCKVRSNQAWAAATSGGGLTTDMTSVSRVRNSLFCNNTAVNINGPWMNLGGNIIAASCP